MIGALPRADVRSANGQAHIEYTFGVNGTVIAQLSLVYIVGKESHCIAPGAYESYTCHHMMLGHIKLITISFYVIVIVILPFITYLFHYSGGSKGGGGGQGGQDPPPPPLRFPGRSSCTWKNSLYLLKNSVNICMIRSIS